MRFEHPEAAEAEKSKLAGRRSLDDDFAKKDDGTAAGAAAGGGAAQPEITMRGHEPLQFSRVKGGKSLLGFDLDQVSDTARFVIWIAAIVIFAGLIYLSYSLVSG